MIKWQIFVSAFAWLIISGEAQASETNASDALTSLKKAFSLSKESWKSADVETHFSLVRPEANKIGTGGIRSRVLQNVDYEEVRDRAKRRSEGWESRIDDLEFNIQGSVATITFNEIGINEDFGGIGAQVEPANQVIRVVKPNPMSPASKAGLKAGDLMVKIDGAEISISEESGKTFLDYLNKVKGKAGTSVTLTISRDDGGKSKNFDVTIIRDKLPSAGRQEERTAVTEIWVLTNGKWLRLHEHKTYISADLVDLARRFVEEVWNKGDLSVIDELCVPDVIRRVPPSIGSDTYSTEEMKQSIISWHEAFPDAKITVNKWGIIASTNQVVVRWKFAGTHKGEYMGIPATGKKVRNSGISILRFVRGKIVSDYAMWDDLHTWKQLGVEPPQWNQEQAY